MRSPLFLAWKGRQPGGKFAPNSIKTSTFVDTNPEHAANFCIALRSEGISSSAKRLTS